MNGGLEIDGAIVDCRSALISAAQGCCLRELASSSALKSLSLPRRDETRPNLATRMRLSIPAPLSQQPSLPPPSQSSCSLLLFYRLSLISLFLFCLVESSRRACPCLCIRGAPSDSERRAGSEQRQAGEGGGWLFSRPWRGWGVRGDSAAGREEGAPLISPPLPPVGPTWQQRDHYGLLIQLR